MARLRYLNTEDLAPEYQNIPRMKSNITRVLANSPRVLGMWPASGCTCGTRAPQSAAARVGDPAGWVYDSQ